MLRGCCSCHALPTQSERGETDGETKGNAILDGNVPRLLKTQATLRPTAGSGSYPGWSDRTALRSGPGRETRPPIVLEQPSSYRLCNRRQKTAVKLCACLEVSRGFIISPPKKKKKKWFSPRSTATTIASASCREKRTADADDFYWHRI